MSTIGIDPVIGSPARGSAVHAVAKDDVSADEGQEFVAVEPAPGALGGKQQLEGHCEPSGARARTLGHALA
jgi:hypothetical protein